MKKFRPRRVDSESVRLQKFFVHFEDPPSKREPLTVIVTPLTPLPDGGLSDTLTNTRGKEPLSSDELCPIIWIIHVVYFFNIYCTFMGLWLVGGVSLSPSYQGKWRLYILSY